MYSDNANHQEGNASFRYAVYPDVNHAIAGGVAFMKRSNVYGQEFSLSYMYYF
jgi:hypothetical protein